MAQTENNNNTLAGYIRLTGRHDNAPLLFNTKYIVCIADKRNDAAMANLRDWAWTRIYAADGKIYEVKETENQIIQRLTT